MRYIFMGSSGFACPALEALLAGADGAVVGVVTQPDRPKGRSLELASCAVKTRVAARGIPVLTPDRVNAPESLAALRALAPDLIVVVAYGQMLRDDLLALPPRGCINLHASLLPRYRGAAPIQWALAAGAVETGVTTMFMDARLDAGDIIMQERVAIEPDDTGGTLHDRLAAVGGRLLARTLTELAAGRAPRRVQDEAGVSYAPKLKKADARIDWGLRAVTIANRVRAFNPWPGCTCQMPDESGSLRVWRARVEPGRGRPGTVLEAWGEGPLVQAGDQAVRLLEVQPEGRKVMAGQAFLCGYPLPVGQIMG